MCNIRKEKQKQKKRMFRNEERLDSKNAFGISDKTAMEAVNNIIEKSKGVK